MTLKAAFFQATALSKDLSAPPRVRELAASLVRLTSLRSSLAEVEALKVPLLWELLAGQPIEHTF